MRYLICGALLLMMLMSTVAAAADDNPVAWAVHDHKKNSRPVLIMLGAPWCHYCMRMQQSTMSLLGADGTLGNLNYEYVDVDNYPDVKRRYAEGGAEGKIPQLILLRKGEKGWTKEILVGERNPQQVKSFLVKNDQGKLREFMQRE